MRVVEFIFSSFWHFIGTCAIIVLVGSFLVCIAVAIGGGTVNIGSNNNDEDDEGSEE